MSTPYPDGVERIAGERIRQGTGEGYTSDGDDNYTAAELLQAATAYVRHVVLRHPPKNMVTPPTWPWGPAAWKPSEDPIRNLEKAGALIAAEIDRLLRAAKAGT